MEKTTRKRKKKPGRGRPRKIGRVLRNVTEGRTISHLNYQNTSLRKVDRPIGQKVTNENDFPENYLGSMDNICTHCYALHFKSEATKDHFNSCCHNGLISIPTPAINDHLKDLILNSSNFVQHIRKYNSAMAFASFSATRKDIPGKGPYCFKIQGQIHRYISDLLPPNDEDPSYGQLYFIDSKAATNYRLGRQENNELSKAILITLQNILAQNPYARAYQSAAEVMGSLSVGEDFDLRFVDNVPMDKRIYNKPTAQEIAGVFRSVNGEPPGYRHVVVHYKQNRPKLMSVLSPHCDPMVYPLLFPNGESGWDPNMTHNGPRRQSKRERLTMLQFACHRLAVRGQFSHLHQSKKLFQQYIVDMYVRVESERLNYVRQHQSDLRVEHYKGLQDFVIQRAHINDLAVGKIVVLPSTFEGSPRNMTQRYQDAMAIVRKFGKPDIFLTMTCNPSWREITEALKEKEKPSDRPDIVSRVFRCKLNMLKDDILKKNVLGVVVAHVYVIEFQKRGLPHCHMLLVLDNNSKLKDVEDIDRCVSAELPDKHRFPRLFNIVLSTMVHGPCGPRNPLASCMKDGKCIKKFPKEFSEKTVENCNGYPKYRRRNNEVIAQKGICQIDNRDIVPFNSYLLLKYNCHINVEICSTVRSVKYLFKYVYKGFDSACMEFVRNVSDGNQLGYDETVSYANMRYVSAHECIWRLQSNEMHEQSHTIIRLEVHEPGHHNIYFRTGAEEKALEASELKRTKLTAWFDLNQEDPSANQYLYTEIPQYYRFINNMWIPRQRGGNKVIGRMYGVVPTDQNRFYLRMLLLHIKGAKSFYDMYTYNGTTYGTFKEAVLARGLLQDDAEWQHCMEEMQSIHMPRQLRELFAYICCFCEPMSANDLWMTFKASMMEDMSDLSKNMQENEALREIDSILRSNGMDCQSIGLPVPELLQPNEFSLQIFDKNAENVRGASMYSHLNESQKIVVDQILASVSGNSNQKLFFLEAPGGCGKTFVYSCILSIVRGRGQIALAAAWTGIAALLLEGGTTLHRLFGLPVPVMASSVSSIKANSDRAKRLREAAVIVIDEASMIPAAALDCIDRLLRDIMKFSNPLLNDVPMGGKIVLFCGDFRQVLPVVSFGSKVQIIESCIQSSRIWSSVTIIRLTQNMRAYENERYFANWLLKLGDGKIKHTLGQDIIEIPTNYLCAEESIIQHVFEDSLEHYNVDNYSARVIVSPLNEHCSEINNKVLSMLPGD